MKTLLANASLGLLAGFLSTSVFAADLQIEISGIPVDSEARITVVNHATGTSFSLGMDGGSKILLKELADGPVTVKAGPVEYQGMTYQPSVADAFMLLQQDYPKVFQKLENFRVKKPALALQIELNLYQHIIHYTTDKTSSSARLFAGLDRGILWNCDTDIPLSCGNFDNAGSKQDMTHIAYGSGQIWASLLNTGGVDDSLLWKCDANAMNACATWDLWPKSQVTVSGIAVGGGRVYVGWWESGLATGSSGIKSCDASASQPVCTDLLLDTKNGNKVLDVVFAGDQVYYLAAC